MMGKAGLGLRCRRAPVPPCRLLQERDAKTCTPRWERRVSGSVVSALRFRHAVSSKGVMQNLYAGVPFAMNLFTMALFVAICVSRPVHRGVFTKHREGCDGRAPGLAVGLRRWRAPAAPE